MRPDSVTDNGNRGLVALYAVLFGYFLILGLRIVAKYFPQHQGVLSGVPYFDYLIGLIVPVGTVLFVVFVEITFVGYPTVPSINCSSSARTSPSAMTCCFPFVKFSASNTG